MKYGTAFIMDVLRDFIMCPLHDFFRMEYWQYLPMYR